MQEYFKEKLKKVYHQLIRFKKILIIFTLMIYVALEGCAPRGVIKNLAEKSIQQNEKQLICLAIFDPERINVSMNEKEILCNKICAELSKIKKFEVIDRDAMHLALLDRNFTINIHDFDTAVSAGKLLKADKVTTSICNKKSDKWELSIKLIDVQSVTIDTSLIFQGSEEEIAKGVASNITMILTQDNVVKVIRKRGLWITCSAAIIGGIFSLLIENRTKGSDKRELPRPSNFP